MGDDGMGAFGMDMTPPMAPIPQAPAPAAPMATQLPTDPTMVGNNTLPTSPGGGTLGQNNAQSPSQAQTPGTGLWGNFSSLTPQQQKAAHDVSAQMMGAWGKGIQQQAQQQQKAPVIPIAQAPQSMGAFQPFRLNQY